MDEVTEIVKLYIEQSDILEEQTREIAIVLEDNIKDVISPGSVGYDTGHLHDSIISNYSTTGNLGVVLAWYGADYGQYWYRWKGGRDFMKEGLMETLALYE